MIARRGLLSGAAAFGVGGAMLAGSEASAGATPPDLRFVVSRNGSPIGRHDISFRQEGSALIASIQVDIVVKLGPIVLYRYGLTAREAWRDGQFQAIDCQTNDNGTRSSLKATRMPDKVIVDLAGKPPRAMPATTLPLTHWNHLCMERPLFNPEGGEPITSKVVARGEENVPLADGRTVRAARFSLVGEVALDNWYDGARTWTSLSTLGTDGSRIEYRRAG